MTAQINHNDNGVLFHLQKEGCCLGAPHRSPKTEVGIELWKTVLLLYGDDIL